MKFVLHLLMLLIAENILAQEITYSIHFPPGGRLGVTDLPESIDTNHFYTYREIKDLAEPTNGWTAFYSNIDTLEYPQEAIEKKLQSSMTVVYKIDENGLVDSVFIESVQNYGNWTKCVACEAQILTYFKESKWSPGRINEIAVKTIDYTYVEFIIQDPNSEKTLGPFGY